MHRAGLVVLFVFAVVGGCQCFEPVEEVPFGRADAGLADAGAAAGGRLDAGLDAGAPRPVMCATPADCTGTPRVTSWCARYAPGPDAGFSCIDGQCVAECGRQAGQTCTQDRGAECLRCPPTQGCVPPSCAAAFNITLRVEEIACNGAPPFNVGDRLREGRRDGGCGSPWSYVQPDGGEELIGELYYHERGSTSARLEVLGGLCLVTEMPTGAIRLLVDCPRCQVALGP